MFAPTQSVSSTFRWYLLLLLAWLVPTQPLFAKSSLATQITEERYTDDLAGIRKLGEIRLLVAYSRSDFFFKRTACRWGCKSPVPSNMRST